jgi:hypothetical protein
MRICFGNTDLFYQFAYDLGRYMHMYPNYQAAFTEDDKKAFLENFPKAFVTSLATLRDLQAILIQVT